MLVLLVLLPALLFLLVMAAAASRGLRQGFVIATVVHTLCVIGATELLSAPAILRLPPVAAFWAVATTLAALWLWRKGDRRGLRRRLRRAGTLGATRRMELAGLSIVLGVVFLIGALSPPNNWESMAYRMMRVAMWLQQGSVAHYATPYLPQLYHAPLGSWHIAHLQLLAGGDRFANAVEWLALVGCAVAASLIAKELKQPFRVQVLAAVLAATLPMALLQGSSTQGNVLAAYWLLCAAWLWVQHLRRPAWWRLAGCGAAAGFALLAKPTMYVLGPPVALALGLYGALACRQPKRTAVALAAVLAVALAVNLGHFARNWELFGHPLSVPAVRGEETHFNHRFGVDVLAANLVRNSLLHWGLPWAKFNDALLEAVADVLGGIPDLPEATLGSPLAKVGIQGRFNEVHAPNLLHYWLLAVAAVGLACMRRRALPFTGVALTRYLLAGWLLAVITFSGAFAWQRWNTRYDLGIFMLGCPLAATFLAAVFRQRGQRAKERYLRVAAGLFLVASLPWLVLKESAPVVKARFDYETLDAEPLFRAARPRAYFNHLGGRSSYWAHVALADAIANLQPKVVGLHYHHPSGSAWGFDYPLYVLLTERLPGMRLTYYDVRNPSAALEGRQVASPDVVVQANALRRRSARTLQAARQLRVRGEGTVYQNVPTHLVEPAGVVLLRLRDQRDTGT